jgi:hypothetical protein
MRAHLLLFFYIILIILKISYILLAINENLIQLTKELLFWKLFFNRRVDK